MKAYVEISFTAPHLSYSCWSNCPGGYEANCTNPEDFGCTQIYSGLAETKAQAYADICSQLKALGATEIVLVETL